jgi:RNA polymerase sigma-70 factor (ECF subfamily)
MDLICRIQAGDEHAFATLFHDYKNLVYKAAYLILDNRQEAEDALQEVFLKVHRKIGSYKPAKGSFTVWLYRVTVNHCLNRQRRHKRRPPTLPFDEMAPHALADGNPSPESQVGADDEMRQALAALSSRLRTTVILRYYAGLTYAEIAEVMNLPLGTVKSRLNQAIKILRRELESMGVESLPARALHNEEVSR